MNKYKKLIKDIGLFFVSNFASKILIFLLVPLYTNLLSTSEYAVADLITATINLVFPIITLCIAEATLRFPFEKDVRKNEVLSIAVMLLIVSTLAVVLAKSFVGYINGTLNTYWWFFCACYFVTSAHSIMTYFSRGCDKTKVFAVSGIVHSVFLVGCNIIFLVYFHWGLVGYLLSIIISYLASAIYILIAGGFFKYIVVFRLNKDLFKEMLGYSIPMIPTVVAWWFMQTSDKYMIIWKVGFEESGIYSLAYKIPTILFMVCSLFTQAWQISAISNYSQKDNNSFVGNVYSFFNLFSVLSCSGLIVTSKVLGRLLFAKDFFVAWKCVPILLIAYVFSGLSGFLASTFTASKKTKYLFVSTSFGAIVNVLLNLLFIEKIGIIGAAYTTLVGYLVTWIIRIWVSQKIVRIEASFLKHGAMYTLLLVQAIFMYKEYAGCYIVNVSILLILTVMNWKEIRELLGVLIGTIKNRSAKNR